MNRTSGFTLIEVLVAIVVLGAGLLGLAALQGQALKANSSALQRSQAVMLAYFMLDAMRANPTAARNGDYDLGTPGSPDTPHCTAPTASNLVTRDQAAWLTALKTNLGNANTTCGLIACSSASCTVKVFWDDSRAGGASAQVIEVTSRL
ncbi:type IV pilus modification protein PilV [Thermochromatium tepidum]|jgi:type IV pilus modification protein PilV|uniref:Type IV pilus modification protein PilV n=1 Tax=Thermochromatium tepidum ATCC 43061 TaxID=316276 RepID=A0A6I6ED18_THETI|nr:type IV pilus modification protein PilV [Thermochromatium tepidum]QGU32839.1 type IV pilus modification protein PilV [Thermochromatium tepidum ATCC 43061]